MVQTGRDFCLARSSRLILRFAHAFDALLHFAHAGHVFVEFGVVARADLAAEPIGALLDAVEDADVHQAAAILKQHVER